MVVGPTVGQVYDRRRPKVVLACSVISLASLLQQRQVEQAFASSSEVPVTITKGLHMRLNKTVRARGRGR